MADEHKNATANACGHVERAEKEIKAFRKEGVDRKGVLLHPLAQAASLKIAREESRQGDCDNRANEVVLEQSVGRPD